MKRLSDEELDELIDDMTEKEILWGIFQQQIETNQRLRVVSMAATIWIALLALGLLLGAVAVLSAR